MKVDLLIPALNEEAALPHVLAELPRASLRRVVVVDNGSTDRTAEVARMGGAEVVFAAERGYGAACLAGLAHLQKAPPEVVVFADADHSDDLTQLDALIEPIRADRADLVIGSRRGQPGLTPQQRAGNRLACLVLRYGYGVEYTDLGPFRALRWESLAALRMRDRNYGWTVEMQARAARVGLRHFEVPVRYRDRIGTSKISGTLRGTLGASQKILWTLARHRWSRP